jgi:hypothetical protein
MTWQEKENLWPTKCGKSFRGPAFHQLPAYGSLVFSSFYFIFFNEEELLFFSKLDLAAVGWLLSYVFGTESSSQPWAINLYFKSTRQ